MQRLSIGKVTKKLKKMLDNTFMLCYNSERCRGVAQFGRVLRSGRRGRRFKSCHLDHEMR